MKFITGEFVEIRLAIYAIGFAAPRYLANWMLAQKESFCNRWPLLDLVTPRFSPYTRCRQYLRSVIRTANTRCLVAAYFAGFRSQHEYLASGHATVTTLRNATQGTSAWLYAKSRKYREPPLELAGIGDTRLSASEHDDIDAKFQNTKACKLDHGLGRKLKRRGGPLHHGRHKRICCQLKRTPVENGSLECLHARNQQHSAIGNSWSSFCADFINSQSNQHLAKHTALKSDAAAALAHLAMPTHAATAQLLDSKPTLPPDAPDDGRNNVVATVVSAVSTEHDEPKPLSGTSVVGAIHQVIIREYTSRMPKCPNVNTLWGAARAREHTLKIANPQLWDNYDRIAKHNAAKSRTTNKRTTHPTHQGDQNPTQRTRRRLVSNNPDVGTTRLCEDHLALCEDTSTQGQFTLLDRKGSILPAPTTEHQSISIGSPSSDSLVLPSARIPRLLPHSLCPRCGCNGASHLKSANSLDTWLRFEPNTLARDDPDNALAKTPLSPSLFALQKSKTFGGYKRMSTEFTKLLCDVGRDTGNVTHDKPLKSCPTVCKHDLSENGQRLLKGLYNCFTSIVATMGGPTAVVATMPSPA